MNGLVQLLFFFFKQKTAYQMRIRDWGADVCSSDLVSPLVVDEVEASKLRTSAPSRCAARWKLSRVRVEGSKNSVHTAVPASERPLSPSTKACARSSSATRVSRGRPSSVSRLRRRPLASSCGVMCGRSEEHTSEL